jgi:hypothetical protein
MVKPSKAPPVGFYRRPGLYPAKPKPQPPKSAKKE